MSEIARIAPLISDEAWAALDALGETVDADLATADVRLTMGGEPTFVSIDNYESPEWTVAALGPDKRVRADELIRRLRARFAPQGLLHYGLGKWYPGEATPRWAFFALLAARRQADVARREPDRARERHARDTRRRREAFRRSASPRDSALRRRVQAAYEDPAHWMLEEGKTSGERRCARSETVRCGGARPHGARLRARARRAGRFRAAAAPQRRDLGERSLGERREHLFLLPGDLPVGSRLPLTSLPHVEPKTIRS